MQLNSMCAIRITAQFTKAGGVLPSYKSRMVSLAPFPFGPGTDDLHSSMVVVAGMFYVWFIVKEIFLCRKVRGEARGSAGKHGEGEGPCVCVFIMYVQTGS